MRDGSNLQAGHSKPRIEKSSCGRPADQHRRHLLSKDRGLEALPVGALCGLTECSRRKLLDHELLVVAGLIWLHARQA